MPNKNSIESEIDDILDDYYVGIDDVREAKYASDGRQESVVLGELHREATNHLKNLIQREVKKGRVEELKRLDKATKTHVYVETDGYLKDRLEELEG